MITNNGFDWIRDRVLGDSVNDFTNIIYDRGLMIETFEATEHLAKNGDTTALALETGNSTEGISSLKMGKSGTVGQSIQVNNLYSKPLAYYKNNRKIACDLYVTDNTTLELLYDNATFGFLIGQDTSNYRATTHLTQAETHVGWNYTTWELTDLNAADTGDPELNNIIFWRIRCYTDNTTDTFNSGDILFDNFRLENDWTVDIEVPHQPVGISDAIAEVVTGNTYSADATLSVNEGYNNKITAHCLSGGIVLDYLDDESSWTINSTNTKSDETSNFIENGTAIAIGKVYTGAVNCYIFKTTASSLDLTNMSYIGCWVYIKDSTMLSKLDATIGVKLDIGTDASNLFRYPTHFLTSELGVGWNFIYTSIDDNVLVGSPDISDINYLRMIVLTANATDTFSTGDIIFDYFIAFDKPYLYNKIVPVNKYDTYQIVSRFDIRVI